MERVTYAHPVDVALFFACGAGTNLCVTSILSCLVYWSDLFGPSSFQFLNLCVFFPLLILSLLQAKFDLTFDSTVGTLRSFTIRGCIGFLGSMLGLGLVVFADTLVILCLLTILVGSSSAMLFGALNQMAAFLSRCGRLKMGFSFGYQGAGVIVLIMSLTTGFGSSASDDGKYYFFFTGVILEGFFFILFLVLLFRRPDTRRNMYQRDLLNGGGEGVWEGLGKGRSERLTKDYDGWGGGRQEPSFSEDEGQELLGGGGEGGINTDQREKLLTTDGYTNDEIDEVGGAVRGEALGYLELWGKAKWCCVCVMATICSSICLGSWFSQVKTDSVVLPQILFFTKIFSDTLGRPPTILFPLGSIKVLAILCSIRLCVIPIFFLSASAPFFPAWGWLLILLTVVLSFSSGFLVTSSYQLAPTTLSREESGSLSKLASLVNVCFSVGCVSGVLLSFLLLFLVSLGDHPSSPSPSPSPTPGLEGIFDMF